MTKYDRISAIFWVGLGAAITVEAIRLGPGSLTEPGPGLIPLGCGLALGILGMVLLLLTFARKSEPRELLWEKGTLWRKLILTLISLLCYAVFLEKVGFLLITFLWLFFVCTVAKLGWKKTVLTAVVVTVCCYVLFNSLLGIRFPPGLIG